MDVAQPSRDRARVLPDPDATVLTEVRSRRTAGGVIGLTVAVVAIHNALVLADVGKITTVIVNLTFVAVLVGASHWAGMHLHELGLRITRRGLTVINAGVLVAVIVLSR